MKTVTLILLTTGQRPQIITKLNVENMHISPSKITFFLGHKDLKQGRQGHRPEEIVLTKFPGDKRICVYSYLLAYLQRTLDIRGKTKELFLCTVKPFGPPSANTVSNWVRSTLSHSGIDITTYGPGSTRGASTSKALKAGVPLQEVLEAGGWSRATTFTTYYNRPILKDATFAKAVLS